jgi:hypothetical protein
MANETSTTRPGADRALQIIEANDELVAFIETCTGDDWGRIGVFGPGGGMPMSVDRLAGARRHLDGHLGSMRAAVGR